MKKITKLEQLMLDKQITQGEIIERIKKKTGIKIGRDRISRMASGTLHNYTIETAVLVADALGVKIGSIVDLTVQKIVERRKSNPKKNHIYQ